MRVLVPPMAVKGDLVNMGHFSSSGSGLYPCCARRCVERRPSGRSRAEALREGLSRVSRGFPLPGTLDSTQY